MGQPGEEPGVQPGGVLLGDGQNAVEQRRLLDPADGFEHFEAGAEPGGGDDEALEVAQHAAAGLAFQGGHGLVLDGAERLDVDLRRLGWWRERVHGCGGPFCCKASPPR